MLPIPLSERNWLRGGLGHTAGNAARHACDQASRLHIPTEVPNDKREWGLPTAGATARPIPTRLAATHPVAIGEGFDPNAAAFARAKRRRFFLYAEHV